MEAHLPVRLIYETPNTVHLADVIESLRGMERVTKDSASVLEVLLPGLQIQSVSISVVEISQRSPLREGLSAALVLIYQDKLAKDMPKLLEHLLGVHIPDYYDNLFAILFIILMVYSAERVFDFTREKRGFPKLRSQYKLLLQEFAERAELTEERVQDALDETFSRGRSRLLFDGVRRVFRPAKGQFNVPITIGPKTLSSDLVAEFPSDAQALEAVTKPVPLRLQDVEVVLHAQDIDRNKRGWAAVIPALSEKRAPLEIYPPIQPSDIYTRESVFGDVLVEQRFNNNGELEPMRFNLLNLRPETFKVSQASLPPSQEQPVPPEKK